MKDEIVEIGNSKMLKDNKEKNTASKRSSSRPSQNKLLPLTGKV